MYMTFPHGRILGLLFFILLSACSRDDDSGENGSAAALAGKADAVDSPAEAPANPYPSVAARPREEPGHENTVASDSDAASRTLNAHDLLEELKSHDWDENAGSDPQLAALLQRLRSQGAGALVAIREYLLEGDHAGPAPPALREALLNILLGLGLPQVEDLALDLLADGVAPSEVWQLGEYLETVQPGMYADVIRDAAERALIEAEPATYFPAEFYRLLGALGNEETALILAETQADRGAYASLALATIPDGDGLSALVQGARQFEAGRDTLEGRLAVQLLAQQATQFPQAAAALIDLAERGAIPHDLWPYVLDIVAGNWVLTMEQPSSGLIGSHTFYRPEGDQVIYRVAPLPGFDDGLQSERLYLLDRLQPLAPPGLGS